MALVALNLNPSKKMLRDFGDIALCMCNVIGGLLVCLDKLSARGFFVFCLIGVIIYVLSRISTTLVKPIYQGMMLVTFPIGYVVSHIVMGLFYYVVVTGVAFVFKLLRRDHLHRKYNPQAKTYWLTYTKKRPSENYFRQF